MDSTKIISPVFTGNVKHKYIDMQLLKILVLEKIALSGWRGREALANSSLLTFPIEL